MATIQSALRDGILSEYRLPAWETRESKRPILIAPGLFEWADDDPRMMNIKLGTGGRDRLEHLEQMLCDFRCSNRPSGGDLRRVMPTKHGIWTLRPYKLRIYGWFHEVNRFVAVCGAHEEDTKNHKNLNDEKRDEVREFLRTNNLEKTVKRGDLSAVLR